MADSAVASADSAGEKDVRRKKQTKRMTKIIAKAWAFPGAEPFQECSHSSSESIRDLSSIGQNLDSGGYHLGRHGWEKFAGDIGGIYNRHVSNKGRHASTARRHLEDVKALLAKIDPHLAEIASKSVASDLSASNKKRKHGATDGGNNHIPKKKHHSDRDSSPAGESLTLSQREKRAMEQLRNYLKEVGGAREQADGFRCKVVAQSSGEKFNTYYFTTEGQGRRLKSMVEVARFLSLVRDERSVSSSQLNKRAGGKKGAGSGRPSNQRQMDAEQRKLKKELEKLMKAHGKATKALDDHRNDHKNDRYPIEDEVLMDEEGGKICLYPPRIADKDGFNGIPSQSMPDLLMVWDFLCTFGRALSLAPIKLDHFASALIYSPRSGQPPPLYLAEAHLSLLKLLFGDQSSDEWWWSTLETEETEMQEIAGGNKAKAEDQMKPLIKVDLASLLSVEEESAITVRWLQALEDVRSRKPNAGAAIKSCVKSARSITTNSHVKMYLRKSMRNWRGNSAGFTKRAVLWLVDRIREARPDLWGRDVIKEEVEEQKNKVARDAAMVMHLVDENANIDNMNEYNSEGESDEDSESEEDEESEDDDDEDEPDGSALDDNIGVTNPSPDEDSKPVTSPIPIKPPPALVDLLLPPHKPPPVSDLVSSFTWPAVAGATCCRILHLYKRRRNEVDDSLREFRELPPLSIAERRRREVLAPHRVLTECMSTVYNGEKNPSETAIRHLCNGGDYSGLSSVQKLCLLRILVEAAYDTFHVNACVDDNIRAKISAVKALDVEERRAKREAREETAAAESAARERLSLEAKDAFIQKKRREIARVNKVTNEFTPEYIEELTDNDVAQFDDDTKAEYEDLPKPKSFNKSEVNTMVARLHEEDAFNTKSLLILTMEEIESREKEILDEMEEELANFGDIDTVYEHADRETTAKIDRLKREISNMKDNLQSLPPARAAAIESLKDAMEDGTIKALKTAIRSANVALLTGADEETDGVWALDLLRDAALELKSAERRKRVTEAQKDLIAKLNKCFVRTDPIGRDRFRNGFWHFDLDEDGRVWVETHYIVRTAQGEQPGQRAVCEDGSFVIDAASAEIGEGDYERDIMVPDPSLREDKDTARRFLRQEYHFSGLIPSLTKRHFGCHESDKSLRSLVKNLDSRGARDGALKSKLKEIIEASAMAAASDEKKDDEGTTLNGAEGTANNAGPGRGKVDDELQTTGDDDHFRNMKLIEQYKQNSVDGAIALDLLQNVTSAVGEKVRLRQIRDPVDSPNDVAYLTGKIIGWKMESKTKVSGDADESAGSEGQTNGAGPVWKVALDKGGEMQLSGNDLLESLSRFRRWAKGIVEEDDPLFSYRNSLGRYCGRSVDAPLSASPSFLARLLLKKEQEYYTKLKSRSYENNWGGKSGARNAWTESMKEYGHEFRAVQDGLVTLEDAFFELSGGFGENIAVDGNPSSGDNRSGKELLADENYRVDVELESIGQVKGLWNSQETRRIFKEIVSSSTTVGFLALALDLLCRNCQVYLEATKPKVTRNSFEQPTAPGTRRMNAWQQQHMDSYY